MQILTLRRWYCMIIKELTSSSMKKKDAWSLGHQDRPFFVRTFIFETKISIDQWQRERMWPPFTKSAFDRSRMADWMNATIKPTLGLDR